MNYSKGSIWRKWDLHFHTPSSPDYKDRSVTNQEIIDNLHKNGISVVAITDHQIIDVDRIIDLQKLGTKKEITVLPGIEILSDARGSDPIHFIGLFPENCNLKYIWGQLENSTNLKKITGEGKSPDEVYCDLESTTDLIRSLGGIISIHAGKKSNSIECITNSLPHAMAQKLDIADKVDIFELGQEYDHKDYSEIVFPIIKRIKPMILCSDNHNINDYKLKQNCWIKADTTFNGLKQIIFEPDSRVKIQHEKPDYKKDYLTIDKVRFIDTYGKFQPDYISINSNLNSIIGGKSSGKSLLLYFIAKTVAPSNVDEISQHFMQNNKAFGYDTTEIDFEVVWNDGKIQLLSKPDELNRPITYVPQLYINEIAENTKDRLALNSLILDTLKEKETYKEYVDSILQSIQKNNEDLSFSISRFFNLSDNAESKRKEIGECGDKKAIQANVERLKKELEDLRKESDFSTEEEIKYKDLFSIRESLSIKQQKLDTIINRYASVKTQLESFKADPKEHFLKNNISWLKESYEFDDEITQLLRILEDNLSLVIKTGIDSFLQFAFKSRFDERNDELKKCNDLLDQNSCELKLFDEKLKNQEKFIKIQKELEEENAKILKIEQKERELSIINSEKSKIDLIGLYKKIYNDYSDWVKKNEEFKTIDENIDLISKVSFDSMAFESSFTSKISKKSSLQNQFSSEFFVGNEYKFDPLKHVENIKQIFDKLLLNNITLNQGNEIRDAIAGLLNDCFSVDYDLNQGGDHLLQMSPGKRGLVLFQLFLKLSNSVFPILIDQPEDSLDNRTVYVQLNDFIKVRKQNRQILMVSHNANLVVSTDSENVIVANQHGQNKESNKKKFDFEYVSGALENSFTNSKETGILFSKGIKEHVCEILEGGEEAFQKRERKYGFNLDNKN
jgi:hypothetical protein